MRKCIANVLCFLLPSRALRKRFRFWLMEFNPRRDRENIRAFLDAPVAPKSVLLVEPSVTHGELVPGFAKYWLDLGHAVDVLLHETVAGDNPFCRFSHPRLRIFRHSYACFKAMVTAPKVREYSVVFFTTAAYARWQEKDGGLHSLHDFTRYRPRGKDATFLVEHRLDDIDRFQERGVLERGRLVTLMDFNWQGHPTLMVNPHYFGEVAITPKNSHVHFIVAGAVDAKRKNHSLLLDAVAELLADGVRNFSITIIGVGRTRQAEIKRRLPRELCPHLSFTGWVTFPELFDHMEKADFFLPLLDPEVPNHKRYITTGVSGSYQLILGFRKPCLIQRDFAAFHHFTDANSIIYDGNDLAAAMKKAVAMKAEEYGEMQGGVRALAEKVAKASLHNLHEQCNILPAATTS